MNAAALFPRKIGDAPMPDPLRFEEDLHRMTGADLAATESAELFAEEQRLRRAIGIATGRRLFVHRPSSVQPLAADVWMRWRLSAVQDEIARRRQRRSP
jgi:hypothetical protein